MEFKVETDQVEVTSNAPERDPNWRFTDAQGHQHYMADGEWPTLKWVEDEPYWCEEHGELHEQGHWECATCGEEIQPGMRPPSPVRKFVPGLRHFLIDGREVAEETYRCELAAAQKT